jgi:aspartyl protease family protein
MEKYLFIAALFVGTALFVPQMLEQKISEDPSAGQQQATLKVETAKALEPKNNGNPLDGRKARIEMNRSGHFVAEARLNGRKAEVLVDTGATLVAINESTARELGIRLKPSDFVYKVRTANGVTEAAKAEIDEIEIGRVRVRNVQASVSRDESLSVILLGMAFLQKLKKFEISDGELVLTQ